MPLKHGLMAITASLLTAIFAFAQPVDQATGALSLFIVEQCEPLSKGARCRLVLVQTSDGQMPSAKVSQFCASGWLASIEAQRGTVERGGVSRGQAVVCGHADPESAIRKAMRVCDEQTLGICQDANQVNIQWAYWATTDVDPTTVMDKPLQIDRLPQAQRCASAVPLIESEACLPSAAVLLRQSGLR